MYEGVFTLGSSRGQNMPSKYATTSNMSCDEEHSGRGSVISDCLVGQDFICRSPDDFTCTSTLGCESWRTSSENDRFSSLPLGGAVFVLFSSSCHCCRKESRICSMFTGSSLLLAFSQSSAWPTTLKASLSS